MSVTPTDSLIGSVLGGRYEIVARVSRGGTAVVYRGIDRRLGRTIAVKVIHSDLIDDPEYVKRFDREARAAALLSHPNIVAVFDQGYAGDRPYIVMEYVHGQSLRSIISASAPLPPALALAYAHEVAKALAAAHEAGIIHRDIKPENVLVTNDGQVKVTDFGLAKTIGSQSSSASQGMLMGTMSYMAPEIQTGQAAMASDVYSAGVVLYEMLTGRKPHTGDDLNQVLYKHSHVDILPPSEALTGQAKARIPDYVDALVIACTSRRQQVRPTNGRVLEEKIAKARRSLDAGLLHDAALVREFSGSKPAVEMTPVAPASSRQEGGPLVAAEPALVAAPAATRLAKAATPPKKTSRHSVKGDRRGSRRRRKAPLVILIVLIVIGLVAGGTLAWWLMAGRWTTVPNLTGLNSSQAESQVVTADLTFSSLEAYSEEVPLGQVIRTEPAGDSRVHRGSEVTAYISRGPERHPMPTVEGLTEDEARDALLNAHLAVGTVTEQFDEVVEQGKVISASQEPNASLPPDTPVDLVVSKGRQPIEVHSYVNQTQEDATAALEAAGFTVTAVTADADGKTYFSCSAAKGTVVAQTPAEGELYKGDPVTLGISQGPSQNQVPAVSGLQLDQARQKLADAGFAAPTIKKDNIGLFTLNWATGTFPESGTMANQCPGAIELHYV